MYIRWRESYLFVWNHQTFWNVWIFSVYWRVSLSYRYLYLSSQKLKGKNEKKDCTWFYFWKKLWKKPPILDDNDESFQFHQHVGIVVLFESPSNMAAIAFLLTYHVQSSGLAGLFYDGHFRSLISQVPLGSNTKIDIFFIFTDTSTYYVRVPFRYLIMQIPLRGFLWFFTKKQR